MGYVSILAVEDEFIILALIESALCDCGFQVAVAEGAQEALERIEAAVGMFQVLVTDIRLGEGADGWRVAERARELSPEIGVVYITGDSAGDWQAKGVDGSIILAKPFTVPDLVSAVSSQLAQRL